MYAIRSYYGRQPSVVAVHPFAALVPFLRLERQRRDRTRVEPLERDRLARHLAIAVFAIVDPAQGSVSYNFV